MQKFIDVHILENTDGPIFCYRSGMTVYEEGYHNGYFSSFGWNGAGFTLNVLEDMPSYLKSDYFAKSEVFSVDVNGKTLRRGWKYVKHDKEMTQSGEKVTVIFEHESTPVRAYLNTVLDGTSILARNVQFENLTDDKMNISSVVIMGGGLERLNNYREFGLCKNKVYSLGYFDQADHMLEGDFHWHDVVSLKQTVASRYSADRFRHPFIAIRNNALGHIWVMQIGYSGGYAFDVDQSTSDRQDKISLSFQARIDGDNPTYILKKGEIFTSPFVHVGMINADLDEAINEMHAHARKSVFTTKEPDCAIGGLIEGGIGPERTMDEKAIKHFIDTMALVGSETIIIDAGWYCPIGLATSEWHKRVGDWKHDETLYPNGLDQIREYAHSKGLLFGMWAEVERAGSFSKIWQEHPDWFIYNDKGERTSILDISKTEVAQHVENAIESIIETYKIDIFRLDYNINYKEMTYFNSRSENGTYRYYENLYALFARVRKKYPNVVFENCASGGARCDYGMVQNFTHTWVSDNQRLPEAIGITNGMTMVLPPERVDRLATGMDSHRVGPLKTIIRHTLFGRPTINSLNCVGSNFNPNQIEIVKRALDIYKTVIRPFAPSGKIYHHTPEANGVKANGFAIIERSACDKSAGVVGVFRLCEPNLDSITVYPKGVDNSANYLVTFDNSQSQITLSGYQMQQGIKVTLASALDSELIIYKAL